MWFRDLLNTDFENKEKILLIRYKATKNIFLISAFVFLLNFYLLWANFYFKILIKALPYTYVFLLLSLFFYFYFLIRIKIKNIFLKILLIFIIFIFVVSLSFPYIVDWWFFYFIDLYNKNFIS